MGAPVSITDKTPNNKRKTHKLFESFTPETQQRELLHLLGRGIKIQKETKQSS